MGCASSTVPGTVSAVRLDTSSPLLTFLTLKQATPCRFPRGQSAELGLEPRPAPCRSPVNAACVHGGAQGLSSDSEVCFWRCVLFALGGNHQVRAEWTLLTAWLLGSGLGAGVRAPQQAVAQAGLGGGGGSCSVVGPQPLTTCFQKSRLLRGWRGRGGSFLSLREA